VKARSEPPARRPISLWRALRIAVLAYLLVMVAVTAWLTKARSTDWDDTLYVAIYPVNGDHSDTSRDYIAALDVSEFNAIPEFFEHEGTRYGIDLTHLVAIDLGAEIPEAPPAPPTDGNPVAIAWWSLELRWFAWRTEMDQSLPTPDIRMFVAYYDPQTHERLSALERERVELESELELVRTRATELQEIVNQQRRELVEQRADITTELRLLRELVESRPQQAEYEGEDEALVTAASHSEPLGSSPDPVVSSVMAQFARLQKDVAQRRKKK